MRVGTRPTPLSHIPRVFGGQRGGHRQLPDTPPRRSSRSSANRRSGAGTLVMADGVPLHATDHGDADFYRGVPPDLVALAEPSTATPPVSRTSLPSGLALAISAGQLEPEDVWAAFIFTAKYVLVAVGAEFLLGFGIALLLNRAFPGRGFITT